MKKIPLLLLLLSTYNSFTQKTNNYKYAIVPEKFSFLKEENQYNLNVLSKLFMQKYGFESYLNNDTIPQECRDNIYNKLFLDVTENGNLFTTKLKVILKDFNGSIILTSPEGTSRNKDYFTAYNEALRMAFNNFTELKTHKFSPEKTQLYTQSIENVRDLNPKMVNQKPYVAKITQTGYSIIDENGTTIITLFKTTQNDVYIAEKNNLKGIVTKVGNSWVFEYYKDNQLIMEEINVIF